MEIFSQGTDNATIKRFEMKYYLISGDIVVEFALNWKELSHRCAVFLEPSGGKMLDANCSDTEQYAVDQKNVTNGNSSERNGYLDTVTATLVLSYGVICLVGLIGIESRSGDFYLSIEALKPC